MDNSQQPIYPQWITSNDGGVSTQYEGLSKREYFTAMASQAINLGAYTAGIHGNKWAQEAAKDSVQMADALLAELAKPVEQ